MPIFIFCRFIQLLQVKVITVERTSVVIVQWWWSDSNTAYYLPQSCGFDLHIETLDLSVAPRVLTTVNVHCTSVSHQLLHLSQSHRLLSFASLFLFSVESPCIETRSSFSVTLFRPSSSSKITDRSSQSSKLICPIITTVTVHHSSFPFETQNLPLPEILSTIDLHGLWTVHWFSFLVFPLPVVTF